MDKLRVAIVLSMLVLIADRAFAVDEGEELDRILTGYKKAEAPIGEGGEPVNVRLTMSVEDFGHLQDTEMDFSLTMYFRQFWTDERLAHNASGPLILPGDLQSSVWIPDLYIEREKDAKIHQIIFQNKLMWIYSDGSITLSTRLSVRVSCPLDLRYFPMDKQSCELKFASYSYSAENLVLKLSDEDIFIPEGVFMQSFDLDFYSTRQIILESAIGDYSQAAVRFYFTRQLASYMLVVYVPSIVLIFIGWLSFFIDAMPLLPGSPWQLL